MGALQIIVSLVYPWLIVPLQTGITLIAVWRSIIDPLGLIFAEGTNVLFFPSFTVFAGSLVLLAFKEEDTLSLDK